MDRGDGSIDVHPDMWMPNWHSAWDQYVDGNQTIATNEGYPGTSLLYVPSYMSDKIASIDDLKKPEIAAMFDTDGNGKGEYWSGDVTWASTKRWQIKFKSYGLDELWEPQIVSADTFKAGLAAAYAASQPQLFYYWTPEWVHAAYDITKIDEPGRYEGCEDHNLDAEDWLETSKFDCVSSDAEIYVAYSKSLEERNPAAAKFLSQIQLDPAVVNQWILEIGRDEKDPQDVAEAWVAANPDIVNSWIN